MIYSFIMSTRQLENSSTKKKDYSYRSLFSQQKLKITPVKLQKGRNYKNLFKNSYFRISVVQKSPIL